MTEALSRPSSAPAPASAVPPAAPPAARLYYGWVLVGVLAFTELTSWGVLYYGFSVFITPMGRDLGWSRAAITGAFSLGLLVSGVVGLGVGRWLDRHGARALMTAGSVAAALLLLAWAMVGNLVLFWLVWAGIGAAMAATLYEPAFAVIARWFVRKRSRALTVLTFVAGLASVIYVPLIAWLVRVQGWRGALITLSIVLAVTTIPAHALLLRHRPEDLGLLPDGGPVPIDRAAPPETSAVLAEASTPAAEAIRSASFRWLAAAFTLTFLVNVAVTVHLISYLQDHGHTAAFAAAAAGAIGAMALPGRLIFTPLGGILPRRWVTASIFLVQAVALAVLLVVPGDAGVWLFVALFGAGFGAITPARAALVAELYGPAHFGTISGTLALVITGARAVAPVGAGLLYTAIGRYEPVFAALAVVSVAAGLTVLRVER